MDPLMAAMALVSSIALPIALRRAGFGNWTTFGLSFALATVLTHLVPWLAHPLPHYGPAYSIAIAFYLIVVGLITSITSSYLAERWPVKRR